MTRGKSPLERVNIEYGGDSPPPGQFRRVTGEWPSTDELLRLLSSGRRRRLVAFLHSRDAPVPLSEAVAHVSESEQNADRSASVATDLHHVHLPKLTDAEVVRYDREAEVLEAGPNADRAVRLLESVADGTPVDSRDDRRSNSLTERCSTDDAFRLLADETRRFLLSILGESDGQVDVDDLVERVAAWKADEPVTPGERRRATIELHHKHLPMLADAGVLEYDEETKTLADGGRPGTAAKWLAARPPLETFETADGV